MSRGERFVDFLCRSLTTEERDGVLGDLGECKATFWQITRELLVLVLYRQLSWWRKWKPWLVLLCVVAPNGIVLSTISRSISGYVVMQLWTRSHSGEWFHTALSGRHSLVAVLCICSAIALEAWCSGFAVAALSPATLFTSATVFLSLWLFQVLEWPIRSSTAWYALAATFVLMIVPMVLGMTSGYCNPIVRPQFAVTLVFLVITGTALSIWTDGWFETGLERWSAGMLPMHPLATRIWPFAFSALPACGLLLHFKLSTKRLTYRRTTPVPSLGGQERQITGEART
jgi:hypothetical protein